MESVDVSVPCGYTLPHQEENDAQNREIYRYQCAC
jgi:hypothetical protein